MSEVKDDPREVLVLLNSLGFVGITAVQLKAFMKGNNQQILRFCLLSFYLYYFLLFYLYFYSIYNFLLVKQRENIIYN